MPATNRDLLASRRTPDPKPKRDPRTRYVVTTYDEAGNMLGTYLTPNPPGDVTVTVQAVTC